MRKGLWASIVLWGAALMVGMPFAYAGEVDLLIQKLIDKGVLSAGEGQELLVETKEAVKKQNASGTNDAIPQWVQNTKIKGDLRLRYEGIRDKRLSNGSGTKVLNHERLRVRLGVETKVNDQMKVGIGIATGKQSDPRSRNVSLGNDNAISGSTDPNPASPKNIVLDYAYAEYTPFQYATIIGGKFQNPMWNPWDMIWKGDITPEGAAVKLNYTVSPSLQLFANNMVFVLRNSDSASDGTLSGGQTKGKEPRLLALQPGLNWNVTDNTGLKAAVAYYKFAGVKGHPMFAYSKGGNSLSGNLTGNYVYNYDAVNPGAELSFKQPFGGLVPWAALFGDYIYNVSSAHPSTGRAGFDYGVKFGYEKVADKNQWTAKLAVSHLGRDAWVDAFTDSDRYRKGMSNTRSYEAIFEYGLGKNTSLVLDYYYSYYLGKNWTSPGTAITMANSAPEQMLQVDWNLKF